MKNKLFVFCCISLIAISVGYTVYSCINKNTSKKSTWQKYDFPVSPPQHDTDSPTKKLPVSSLEFDNLIVDFGDVSNDTTLVATYVARNTGKNDIVIAYVNPECTCTSYHISKTTLPPNDTLSIALTFDTKGKINKQLVYATVRANTEVEMHKLLIKANVIR